MEEYKINLLTLLAMYDIREVVFWNKGLDFFITCSDLFAWGFADLEKVDNQKDVDMLEQSVKDCEEINEHTGSVHAAELYCARKRCMRPQGAYYNYIGKELWPLFDACGPEREITMGNPKPKPAE